ncbi:MAG: hypothetical protein WA970_02225 [Gammaproteobacteria bacterium]
MKKVGQKFMKMSVASVSSAALALLVGLGTPAGAPADEAHAKSLLKAMSDYLAAQKALSFEYDTYLVTRCATFLVRLEGA